MAFLVVLESMTPAERVAFMLHDVFGYPFAQVAEVTGRTPAACRQLASSARRRLRAAQTPTVPAARHAGIIRDFKEAWEAKDIGALIGLLDPDAIATADGGGLVQAALHPIEGAEQIARYFVDLFVRAPANLRSRRSHRQRRARPGGSPGRRHRDGLRVRCRRRTDQADLGRAQSRKASPLDRRLTRRRPPASASSREDRCPRNRVRTSRREASRRRRPWRPSRSAPPHSGPRSPTGSDRTQPTTPAD